MNNIKEKAITYDYLKNYMIFGLLACSLVLMFFYSVLLFKTIYNTSQMKGLSAKVGDLTASSSDVEANYMKMISAITLDMAHDKGYKESDNTLYVSRNTLGSRVSLNNEL